MHLYLIRHAEALPDGDDSRRPLSAAGMRDAENVARFLASAHLVRPSEIRHSTRLRARQTSAHFARIWDGVPEREIDGLEPHDDVHALAPGLAEAPHDLALVGHLPFLPRLASLLLCGDADADWLDLSPAGVLCLVRLDSLERRFCLRWMLTPRLLG
jgi:phosphohistidine phosphatase